MNYYDSPVKNKFPLFDLGDYILREQTMDDVKDFYQYYTDPEVNECIVSDIPRSLEEARIELKYWIDVFYNNSGIYFGIAKKCDNKLIGSIGITSINRVHNRAEISYDLAKEYWQKGVMTKSLKKLLEYAFITIKINRLEAYALKENVASRKLLTKCNFNLEGELKQHRRHKSVYKDIGIFSLVLEDYQK